MMAAAANGTGNLVDEFEEAFQSCLNVLTKDEALPTLEKDEIKVEVDHTILRFIDLARQMEAFFLQKRFLLSALKPELVVKEDTNELRLELVRKEELIKRHHDKIAVWQGLLADLQVTRQQPTVTSSAGGSGAGGSGAGKEGEEGGGARSSAWCPQGWAKSPAQGTAGATPPVGLPSPAGPLPPPGPAPQQQNMQLQQQMQQMQMMQQQQMQQQQMQQQLQQQGAAGAQGAAGLFMQQGGRGFAGGAALQGPLAFLEKTTSNIGMPEGRR